MFTVLHPYIKTKSLAFSGATGGEQTKIQAKIQGMSLPKLRTIFEDIERDGEVKICLKA